MGDRDAVDAVQVPLGLAATEIAPNDPSRERKPADAYAAENLLGAYVTERIIGGGGCGLVYAARHRSSGQRVAIKVLRPELAAFPNVVTRFAHEAEAINQIRHPNIITIHEFGELEPGRPYYVMELVDGVDLQALLQLHGRFSAQEAAWLMAPVCHAVQAAHDAGFIHRDIKASNIMLAEGIDAATGRRAIKLLDFGIAKRVNPESNRQGLTEPGARIGTVHNMAPEQLRCEALDARADVYALGVLLYQLLTGQHPFHADEPNQVARLHLQAPPPRPSSSVQVSPAVDAVVLRCLEKQRERRYASVSELLLALQAAVGEAAAGLATIPARALGFYVSISMAAEDEFDDALLSDLSDSLDLVEQALAARRFTFPLRTSSALLGVRPLADDDSEERERAEAAAIQAEASSRLRTRPNPHPGLTITVSYTIGRVLSRSSTAGLEIVGGTLLDVETWMEQTRVLWEP